MKNLLRLSTVMLSLGMLGAAACSSCSPAAEDTSSKTPEYKQSYTCGAGTVRQGNQCVAAAGATAQPQRTAIPASGNN